jgi:uncharacterized protein YjiS (DUF1127 family)
MAKVIDRNFGVASLPALHRAMLDGGLPRGRRHGEINSFRIWDVVRAWQERRRARRELREMDDALLRDAGLEPAAARREAKRPFYLPIHLDRSRN